MNYIFGLDSDEVEDVQDGYSETIEQDATEARWQRGIHITQGGSEIHLKDMKLDHLKNCIRFFGDQGYDIRPLQDELRKRV